MAVWLRPIADTAFSLVFPADCRICQEPLVLASRLPVCQPCRDSIQPIAGALCPICGERIFSFSQAEIEPAPCGLCRRARPSYSRAVAYGAFEGALRDAIHLLKYDRVLPAAKFLGGKLGEVWRRVPAPSAAGWLVVPVPLHPRKLRQRGFNQSELIAREALRRGRIPAELVGKFLVRQRRLCRKPGSLATSAGRTFAVRLPFGMARRFEGATFCWWTTFLQPEQRFRSVRGSCCARERKAWLRPRSLGR